MIVPLTVTVLWRAYMAFLLPVQSFLHTSPSDPSSPNRKGRLFNGSIFPIFTSSVVTRIWLWHHWRRLRTFPVLLAPTFMSQVRIRGTHIHGPCWASQNFMSFLQLCFSVTWHICYWKASLLPFRELFSPSLGRTQGSVLMAWDHSLYLQDATCFPKFYFASDALIFTVTSGAGCFLTHVSPWF